MSDKETITITLKRTHASAASIDGFGRLEAGKPREASVEPHVAGRLRAMKMFDVVALPGFEIQPGKTAVKLDDGVLGLVTKGPITGPWLVQVPGEDQERTVGPDGLAAGDEGDLFAAAQKAYKDPWRMPRWLSVALSAGLSPPEAKKAKSRKENE